MKKAIVCPLLLILTAGILQAEPAPVENRQSISQYGITWEFDKKYPVGKFITGDWWVVGPVTIISVTPAPETGRNGSVVNPPAGDKQGYDDRAMRGFDASLRAVFPLVLKPSESLVTAASVEKIGVKTPDTVAGQKLVGSLRTAAVLTSVATPPASDAFRPAYVGSWKEMFTAGQIRRDLLPKLKAPAPLPDPAQYERVLERIWLDHEREYVNEFMHPLENMPDYGREIASITSTVGLMLLVDDPTGKYNTVLLQFIQKGLDYYGVVQSDPNLWIANGGHQSGRKWPILFAGLMLGHEGMKHVKATFQEDQQTYEGKGFRGQTALWRIQPKGSNIRHEEVDPDTWDTYGIKASEKPDPGRNCDGVKAEAYRCSVSPGWIGAALAARVTGMTACWDHPVFFAYVDRWISEELPATKFDIIKGGKKTFFETWSATPRAEIQTNFVKAMWEAYRAQADAIATAKQGK